MYLGICQRSVGKLSDLMTALRKGAMLMQPSAIQRYRKQSRTGGLPDGIHVVRVLVLGDLLRLLALRGEHRKVDAEIAHLSVRARCIIPCVRATITTQ